MAQRWYALYCKPHKERWVAHQLGNLRIKHLFPSIKRRNGNSRTLVEKPFFPGYIFVFIDLDETSGSIIHWMPGTVGLVKFYGEPAVVPESVIETLNKRIISQSVEMSDMTKTQILPGEAVVINQGPLAGYRGIMDVQISGSQRVRILIKMLGEQSKRLELPASQIQPANLRVLN